MSAGDALPKPNLPSPDSPQAETDSGKTPSDSTKTTLNSHDGTVAINRSNASGGEAPSRKLKRVAKGSGDSRYARLSEDRRRQKSSTEHKSADDFVGVFLGGGRYKILGKLGKGSMAYVFRAHDNRLETDVVVKIPKPEKLEGEEIRERFQKESQLLVRLAHPNVVNVLDVGEHERVPYVVMQLLSGGTLLDKMDDVQGRMRRMKPEFLKTWLREVARALDYCAKQGTVHRDVKPANILFDDDGNGYIADFGLTKIMFGEHTALNSSDTTAGIVLGTPNYIAPEIVLGKPYNGRADQYSLGITVYHALIGRPPMQGPSATVTMINQTQKRLQLLSDISSDVPKEMALAIRKCIEKDADKRFDSCEDFADAVVDSLRSSSMSSTSLSHVTSPHVQGGDAGAATTKRRPKPKRPTQKQRPAGHRKSDTVAVPLPADTFQDDGLLADFAESDGSDWLVEPAPGLPKRKKSSRKSKGRGKKKARNSVTIGKLEIPLIGFIGGIAAIVALIIFALFLALSGPPTEQISLASSTPSVSAQLPEEPSATPKNRGTNNNQRGGKKKNQRSQSPANSVSATTKDNSPAKVASKPKIQQVSAERTAMDPPAEAGKSRRVVSSIPWTAGDAVTSADAECPVIVVGSNVWSKQDRKITATLADTYPASAATALSSDGSLFAASTKPRHSSNNAVSVWNASDGSKALTVPGSQGRGVDVVLLGGNTVFIAGRNSDLIDRWLCRESRKLPPIRIPGAKFSHQNTTLSADGKFIATVIGSRMTVWSTGNGKRVAEMTNPAAKPNQKRNSLLGTGLGQGWKPANEAAAFFDALQSVTFSPDGQFLSAFSNHASGRMACWNGTGKMVADHAAHGKFENDAAQPALAWFDADRAWLANGRVVLRRQGRVAVVTSTAAANPILDVYSSNHLIGAFEHSAQRLSIVHIPFEKIATSLKSLRDNGNAAQLSREKPVSMDIHLGPDTKPSSPAFDNVRKAFRSVINRDGLKIEKNADITFRLRVATGEETKPLYDRFKLPGRKTQTPTPDASEAYLVAELLLNNQEPPIWRERITPADEIVADAKSGTLASRVESRVLPYFIPNNDETLALPVMVY